MISFHTRRLVTKFWKSETQKILSSTTGFSSFVRGFLGSKSNVIQCRFWKNQRNVTSDLLMWQAKCAESSDLRTSTSAVMSNAWQINILDIKAQMTEVDKSWHSSSVFFFRLISHQKWSSCQKIQVVTYNHKQRSRQLQNDWKVIASKLLWYQEHNSVKRCTWRHSSIYTNQKIRHNLLVTSKFQKLKVTFHQNWFRDWKRPSFEKITFYSFLKLEYIQCTRQVSNPFQRCIYLSWDFENIM